MRETFFPVSQVNAIREPPALLPKCGLCGLAKQCRSPKMAVTGSGYKQIYILAEAPGKVEDDEGRQFVGPVGRLLRRSLKKCGVDMDRDCWLDNSLRCRPPDNKIHDKRAVEWCRPNITRSVAELKPKLIILLGKHAVESLIGHLWKEDTGGIKRWAGWKIPCQRPNAWICPTLHPSFVQRKSDDRDHCLYQMIFDKHLKEAVELADDRPWDEVPDYASQIECVYDVNQAARIIRKMIEKGGEVAFDYETDRLKPDLPEAEIVCCSVCWNGKKTIAFPWHGEAVAAMKELLLSPLAKIASNEKFEERWSIAKLGCCVRNWKWDTMQNAHVLDSRSKITSIKFQAFVQLGQTDYDSHLKPFLESTEKGGNAPNRVREIDLKQLLLYCGIDSLLEFLVAKIQMKTLGVR